MSCTCMCMSGQLLLVIVQAIRAAVLRTLTAIIHLERDPRWVVGWVWCDVCVCVCMPACVHACMCVCGGG